MDLPLEHVLQLGAQGDPLGPWNLQKQESCPAYGMSAFPGASHDRNTVHATKRICTHLQGTHSCLDVAGFRSMERAPRGGYQRWRAHLNEVCNFLPLLLCGIDARGVVRAACTTFQSKLAVCTIISL